VQVLVLFLSFIFFFSKKKKKDGKVVDVIKMLNFLFGKGVNDMIVVTKK
jgi:hypothetical protein